MPCRLRSVCAVVPSVCLLLHQGLDEWLCGLHEKFVVIIDILNGLKRTRYKSVSDEKKQSLIGSHWKKCQEGSILKCKPIVMKTTTWKSF